VPEPVVDPPESVKPFWIFAWNIPENALEPDGSPPAAAETALPMLVLVEVWVHEALVVVPDKQAPPCLFS
jgi:hypothetical protein